MLYSPKHTITANTCVRKSWGKSGWGKWGGRSVDIKLRYIQKHLAETKLKVDRDDDSKIGDRRILLSTMEIIWLP